MMKPNQIRAELLLNDKRITDIARELGLKHPNVSAVIAGKRPTLHIRKAIAKAINKPVDEIWPTKEQ